jgi:hypothetical protein
MITITYLLTSKWHEVDDALIVGLAIFDLFTVLAVVTLIAAMRGVL